MNKMNPMAIALWIFLSCIGYLIGDVRGAVWGALLGIGFSLLVDFASRKRW